MKKKAKKAGVVIALALTMISESLVPDFTVCADEPLPPSFDQRSRGIVTEVKTQDPFMTCWAFGTCSAAETSILSEMGVTAAQFREKNGYNMDLSEKHLTWWAYHTVPKNDPDDKSQAGEGIVLMNENPKDKLLRNAAYEEGGTPFGAVSLYAAGLGPVREHGRLAYRGYTKTGQISYSPKADWTLKNGSRDYLSYELEDGNILPSPAVFKTDKYGITKYDKKGYPIYAGYNPGGTEAIKRELYNGRGVSIAYQADVSEPTQLEDGRYNQKYLSENWAQFTDGKCSSNHIVAIVGWDDNYPLENFNATHRPPAPGAWLVKNSWGTGETDPGSHNYYDGWGIENDAGVHTGYFWLSYYDHSIDMVESYNFSMVRKKTLIVGQYDLMQNADNMVLDLADTDKVKMANVFKAPRNMNLRSIGVNTAFDDTKVNVEVYRVRKGYRNPVDGKKIASAVMSFPYSGYHRIGLNSGKKLPKGAYYSVVVTEQSKSADNRTVYNVSAAFGLGKSLSKSYGLDYYTKAVVNKGESFFGYSNGKGRITWVDWRSQLDYEKGEDPELEDYEIDNFAIKAFSDPVR